MKNDRGKINKIIRNNTDKKFKAQKKLASFNIQNPAQVMWEKDRK